MLKYSSNHTFSQKVKIFQYLTPRLQQGRWRDRRSLPRLMNLRWMTLHHCRPGSRCVACTWTHRNKNRLRRGHEPEHINTPAASVFHCASPTKQMKWRQKNTHLDVCYNSNVKMSVDKHLMCTHAHNIWIYVLCIAEDGRTYWWEDKTYKMINI